MAKKKEVHRKQPTNKEINAEKKKALSYARDRVSKEGITLSVWHSNKDPLEFLVAVDGLTVVNADLIDTIEPQVSKIARGQKKTDAPSSLGDLLGL